MPQGIAKKGGGKPTFFYYKTQAILTKQVLLLSE